MSLGSKITQLREANDLKMVDLAKKRKYLFPT